MARHRLILVITLALVVFGLIMVGNASIVDAYRDFNDQWYFLKLQLIWAGIGLFSLLVAANWNHRNLEIIAKPLFLATVVLLIIVLIPGIGIRLLGARRWINLGFTSLQPAELVKITGVIYLSALMQKKTGFLRLLVILGFVGALIMLEPDLGTTLVIMGAGVICIFVGMEKSYRLALLAPVLALIIAGLIALAPYRLARIRSFLDHSYDPQGSSYQIRQSLIGLGSGGVWGVGLGQSRQKYNYLPEVTTDSIFAVVGEELGLIWSSALIVLFSTLVYQGLMVSRESGYPFSKYLSLGISALIGLQAFINISAVIALFPLTGVPLPFISYGGSSLVIMMFSVGIMINISKNNYAGK